MSATTALRRLVQLHKWSSIACTAFLLLLCVTGLPLVFREEIKDWLEPHSYAEVPTGTPMVSLDRLAQSSRELFPGQIIAAMVVDDDEPQVIVWMGESWAALRSNRRAIHFIRFDSRTGDLLEKSQPLDERPQTFLNVMLSLHRDLFAEFAGELLLAFMGFLFLVAVISGLLLYGPFMRKLDCGTIRTRRTTRVKWLDLHNLLGVVTVAWALVVGATGIMNELATPLFDLWRRTEVPALLTTFRDKPPLAEAEVTSVQGAIATVKTAQPNMVVSSVTFPGSPFGTPYHYLIWTKGATPLTARLFMPVLVDGKNGTLTATVPMPWYLRVLELSRPLHFGDYGGLPLKTIWALLDLATIVVLGSGLYLWLGRGKTSVALEMLDVAGTPMITDAAE